MRFFFPIIIFFLIANCSAAGGEKTEDKTDSGTCLTDTCPQTDAAVPDAYYNDMPADVAKIESVLGKAKKVPDLNDRIISITQEFIGTPYVGGTLNVPAEEQLYVNTTSLDCLTFVETVTSLAKAAGKEKPTVEDFLRNLQGIRYRDGEVAGYPSRLHYFSEWAIDNQRRGNLREISGDCEGAEERVKTIDYMTKNRKLYPALKDEDVYEAIKENEKPLKDFHYFMIPTAEVEKTGAGCLKSGDIVAIVTNKAGLDVSHVGVLEIKEGVPYLIHASSKYKKVVNDTLPLKDYLKQRKSPGIRAFRIL